MPPGPTHPVGGRPPPDGRSSPLVSIILPTYQRAGLLPRALRSVLAQTEPSWELIVVDDASSDSTPRVVASFVELDDRIRAIRRARNGGELVATNDGLAAARGTWVAVLHSDDQLEPRFLAANLEAASAAGRPPVMTSCARLERYGDGHERVVPATAPNVEDLLHRRADLCMSNHLFRRDVLVAVGFDPRLRVLGDWDVLLGLMQAAPTDGVALCDEAVITLFRDHVERDYLDAELVANPRLLAKHREAFDQSPSARSVFELRQARLLGQRGALDDARSWYLRSWRSRPANVDRLVLAAATRLGAGWHRRVSELHVRAARLRPRWRRLRTVSTRYHRVPTTSRPGVTDG